MECNKDEAMRAKDIAERKFTERDFTGAKKFALKAQTLYPGLENISQMLTTLEVYLLAENKINGETDMYGTLGVTPLADDDTIKKQYKKLVLLLHPDKNKFIGADGAFQLVKEAFNVLSDKAMRSAYNSRRNVKTQTVPQRTEKKVDLKVPQPNKVPGQQKVPNPNPTLSGSTANGYHKTLSAHEKLQKCSTQKASFLKKGDTFWTACLRCKVQYEFQRVYVNKILNCPHCQIGFMAVEVPPPSNLSSIPPNQHRQQQVKLSRSSGLNNLVGGGGSARWSPRSGTTVYNNISFSEFVPGSASQMMNGIGKRKREEPQGAARSEGRNDSGIIFTEVSLKKRREDAEHVTPSETGMGTAFGKSKEKSEAGKTQVHKELLPVEVRKMLTERSREEIRDKLKEWKSTSEAKEKARLKGKDRHKPNLTQNTVMSVSDSDFHVFDLNRSGNCFKENQVWAAYDDDDGMPRFYALIHKVISLDPFEVRMSWLNSKSNSEFTSVDWIGRGFLKICGDFWVGKHFRNTSLNSFSHKVKWAKGPRGVIQIYPKKGEIWALYREWSPDWDKDIPGEIRHAYDMVEVEEDYNEESGVSVALLCKATGFQTVFYKQKEIKHIPKEEMLRFSHQVPSHILTGEESPNAPKGYVELDPAATSSDLLNVIKTAS